MSRLRKSAHSALLWGVIATGYRDVLQFAAMLVLARLLDPSEYGRVALAQAITAFIGVVSFKIVASRMLQERDPESVDVGVYFTLGVLLNTVCFLAAEAAALVLHNIPTYAQTAPVLAIVGFSFLLEVFGFLWEYRLQSQHNWMRLRILHILTGTASAAISIGLASIGFGAYALALALLAPPAIFAIDFLARASTRRLLAFRLTGSRQLLGFGATRSASVFTNVGRQLLEQGAVTRAFNFSVLGVFNRAVAGATLLCGKVTELAFSSLYSVITRAEAGSERFRAVAALTLRGVVWVSPVLAVFFALDAKDMVQLLFGPRWADVAIYLPLALALAATRAVYAAAYGLLLANERPRTCLWLDAASMALGVPLVVLILKGGLIAYLWGSLVVAVAILIACFAALVRSGGVTLKALGASFLAPLVASLVAAAVLEAVRPLYAGQLPTLLRVGLDAAAFFSVYLLTIRIVFAGPLRELVDYLPFAGRLRSLLRLPQPAAEPDAV
jgi:O-antigen/teichoic acid export membrane protein